MKHDKQEQFERSKGWSRTRVLYCSDCGHTQQVTNAELKRAFRVRCKLCGGPMNRRDQK